MDRREELSLPGSAPYYMQRGMAGPGPQRSLGVNSITSILEASYQPDSFGSALPQEHPTAISHQGVNVGAGAPAPQAEVARRKRGRPRKYRPEGGGGVSLALSPASSSRSTGPTPTSPTPTGKRGRGRPPGTGRKQQLASLGDWPSGSAGTSFTPHVITVSSGEDIATKIRSFSQQSSRSICVLSASGVVSAATLRQPSTSAGTVTYEGHFEILCLSGSYLPSDGGGPLGRTGGLSVSLASADGRVVGGGVGGVLIAANRVKVIVGSFFWGNSKMKNKAKESLKGSGESDHLTAGSDPVAPAGFARSQNLSPPSSVGVWPGLQSMDMQNVHIGIDLMRK